MRRADLEKWIAQQQQVVAESEAPETPKLKGPKAPAKRKVARKPARKPKARS
jgi:hypothetical protein